MKLSRRGVVELALLPACLRGKCHADAVVADQPEQLAPGVQQRLLVQAADHTLQVDIIQIGRIARHLDPEDGEVRKIAELRGDILGRELPVADIAQITLVGARRVARALPGGIRERAVGHEGHRFHRVDLPGKGSRQGAQLVAELLVAVAQDLRDTEIDRCEACEREVAPAVVGICRRIVRRVEVVEDTHTYILDRYGADLALFEFERYELLILVHALDHPGARSAPVIPDADADTVFRSSGTSRKRRMKRLSNSPAPRPSICAPKPVMPLAKSLVRNPSSSCCRLRNRVIPSTVPPRRLLRNSRSLLRDE